MNVTKKQIPQIVKKLSAQVDAFLVAKAFAMTWREKMDEWDKAELQRFEYKTAQKWVEKGGPQRITSPSMTYLMEDLDFEEYATARQDFIDSLKVEGLQPGYCPALVAENNLMKCEHILIESAKEFFGVDAHSLVCKGLDTYRKYIDLLVGMVLASRRECQQ